MSFRIAARTILHLGSELISSDGIAFYELIKNSLDARSPEIRVNVVSRIEFSLYDQLLRELGGRRAEPEVELYDESGDLSAQQRRRPWRSLRQAALDGITGSAPGVRELREQIEAADSRALLLRAVQSANFIEFDDDGDGMSLAILRRVYLTIGTSERAREREREREDRRRRIAAGEDVGPERKILGEKGLGRLSAMRLGDIVEIITGPAEQSRWNCLDIDWGDFADAADQDLQDVTVEPYRGGQKDSAQSGTLIRISGLRAEWTEDKLNDLIIQDLSKLVDPFDPASALPLEVHFNGEKLDVPGFASFLIEHAHGYFDGEFSILSDGEPQLAGMMNYIRQERHQRYRLRGVDLADMAKGAGRELLRRIGPFEFRVYWYNRRVLTKIEGIGNLAVVRRLVAQWAGGVAVYRDGFRVHPYASLKDDWLNLDRDAFSTSGFKLNRGQVIGRVSIAQSANPYLIDQTNREGLKDTPEKGAFVAIMAGAMEYFRRFLVVVDEDLKRAAKITAQVAVRRFREEDAKLAAMLPELIESLPNTADGRNLKRRLRDSLDALRETAEEIAKVAQQQDTERDRLMHLASIGLMIEILAHELYRATSGGLDTISQARRARDAKTANSSLLVLDAQLRTLQKRLKVLDPLSTNARQTKESFELVQWVTEIVELYARQNSGEAIQFNFDVYPENSRRQVRAVKGMFVQVIENLLSNSAYWIKHKREYDIKVAGELRRAQGLPPGLITVRIETEGPRIIIMDTGPGIPEDRRDLVFEPFFSTKPKSEGKGLGLYIAREIAEYHGGTLSLGDPDADGNIHTIIFDLGGINASGD